MTQDLRYPIGRFRPPAVHDPDETRAHVDAIARLPTEVRDAVDGLERPQLLTPYRDGGWTVAQVVHHLADSHMHSYLRCRFALAEDAPTIAPYDEKAWAALPDATFPDIGPSLALLEALHARWTALLLGLEPHEWAREYVHPERGANTLAWTAALYAWHGRHHVAHVTSLRARSGW